MSDIKKTGGPAFPVPTVFNPHSGEPQHTGVWWDGDGMSLRDWFAGMALQGALANPSLSDTKAAVWHAAYAYDCADAMLAEREKE